VLKFSYFLITRLRLRDSAIHYNARVLALTEGLILVYNGAILKGVPILIFLSQGIDFY